ncbi:MAG: hypothetical protein ABI785_14585, partial [Gemmatimonadales bacterium]
MRVALSSFATISGALSRRDPSCTVCASGQLKFAQLGLGQCEKRLVVLPQRLGRERGKGVAGNAGEGDEPNGQAADGGSYGDTEQEHGDVHEFSGRREGVC